ncbi:MAG: DUF3084 domain-containing protein [Elainellaceae cyanobacterium]
MTTGLVLIAAVLILGGVIATLGDRIGMRVGKARLSLFNLRPRQTATLVTILTGVIISATTFALLFAVSDQLRTGVFELREIQDDLETARTNLGDARTELSQARSQRNQVQNELEEARDERRDAQQRLRAINQSLEDAIARQARTESQLATTRNELNRIEANFQQAQSQLREVSQQATALRSEIRELEAEREAQIAQRDQEIAERNEAIAEREARLRELENQRASLNRELQNLEDEIKALREGSVVLLRNQTLASGVIRVIDPDAAPQAVDQLLREANRAAIQAILPGSNAQEVQVIQITNTEVEQLINEIRGGEDYLVRIFSQGNYLVGETCVLAGQTCIQVAADAVINEVVFDGDEVLAATTLDPSEMTTESLIDRIELLVAATQFRAQRAGILSNIVQIAYGREQRVSDFFQTLQGSNNPVEVQTVAAEPIYTAGPVIVQLVAVRDGQVLFSTEDTNEDI